MKVKQITVPEVQRGVEFQIVDGQGRIHMVVQDFAFRDFLLRAMDQWSDFAKGPRGAREYNRLAGIVEAADGRLLLEQSDYALLSSIVSEATFVPSANRRFVPFYDAIVNALDVEVDVKKGN